MIKLATIGTSEICSKFIEGANLTGRFELYAVYSRTLQKGLEFGEKHNCNKIYTDLKEMAEDSEIDGVYIASPNSLHYEQSKLMLENGKNVICEKPITCSSAEYIELKNLADSKGLIYMEAIMSANTDSAEDLKQALKEIGNISLVRIDFSQRSSRLDKFISGEKVNIFDMSLKAGCLNDIGIYCVYAVVDMFGMPKNIIANKTTLYNGADGTGIAIFDYNDFYATLTYSKTGQSSIGSEIIGCDGTVKISSISQYAGITLVKGNIETQISPIRSKAEIMSFEAQNFANYIEKYEEFMEKYQKKSQLTLNVHICMDKIKKIAEIYYPE